MRTPVVSLLLAAIAASGSENWPQFRGSTGDGRSDATGLPTTWSEQQHVKWKTPIPGEGWSSPVIWGNQIWLTTATEDGKELFVVCVDRDTGKIVFDKQLFEVAAPQCRRAGWRRLRRVPVVSLAQTFSFRAEDLLSQSERSCDVSPA